MSTVDDLKSQWERVRAAEQAWLDSPNMATAQAFTDAFKAVKIGAVGALLADHARLQAIVDAARGLDSDFGRAIALGERDAIDANMVDDYMEGVRLLDALFKALAVYDAAKGE